MCWVRGCDCPCATCVAAQERNNSMLPHQLAAGAIGAAPGGGRALQALRKKGFDV